MFCFTEFHISVHKALFCQEIVFQTPSVRSCTEMQRAECQFDVLLHASCCLASYGFWYRFFHILAFVAFNRWFHRLFRHRHGVVVQFGMVCHSPSGVRFPMLFPAGFNFVCPRFSEAAACSSFVFAVAAQTSQSVIFYVCLLYFNPYFRM